ncbi:LysR family transcriptional regulator, partial [Kitasatospora sp. NPDC091257]
LVPRPGVVELEVTAPRTRRAIGLAWAAGRPLTPPARTFRDFVLSRRGRLLQHD